MSKFNVQAFQNDPSGYIGTHKLRIDTIVADTTGSATQTIAVQVQKEDNSYETITESIKYTVLALATCRKTLYSRIDAGSNFIFGKTQIPNDVLMDSYYLPWENGVAYAVQLDASRDYFATAQVNGCCVIISGDRKSPLIIHVNYKSNRLDLPKEEVDKMSVNQMMAANSKHQFKQYTRFYGNLAHKMIDDRIIDHTKPVSVYDPEFYLAKGGVATMYGVRNAAGWTFYFNLQKGTSNVTAELWPAIVGRMP